MERIILKAACLLFFMVSFVACEGLSSGEDSYGGIALTKSNESVRDATNGFSLDLFRQVADGSSNVFVSPMSLSMLNLMLANGAEGDTYREILQPMGLGTRSLGEINDYYQLMMRSLSRADKSISLSLSNSLWTAKGVSVKSPYKRSLVNVYDADLFSVDFSSQASVDKINQWSNRRTNGQVPKLLDKVDGQTSMMLVNALYFQGEWTHKFKEEASAQGSFESLDGTSTQAIYMHQITNMLNGYADEEVCVVRMPYGNGAFYMEAILPLTDYGNFIQTIDMEKLAKWSKDNTEYIDLKFPRMDFEFDSGDRLLTGALQALGMHLPFSAAANFSGISDDPLSVSAICQKSRINVDEGGTIAAVSGLAKLRGAPNLDPNITEMHFNRPFIFLIRESSTGCILFMGAKVR